MGERCPAPKRPRSSVRHLVWLLPALVGLAAASRAEAVLEIEIECLRSARGSVRVALFDSSRTHLETAARSAVLAAAEDRIVWRVPDLSPGHYSLAVYHDRNDNGRLDRTFLGLPGEPYGFSNGRRARFGPPSWRAARFSVDGPATRISICVK